MLNGIADLTTRLRPGESKIVEITIDARQFIVRAEDMTFRVGMRSMPAPAFLRELIDSLLTVRDSDARAELEDHMVDLLGQVRKASLRFPTTIERKQFELALEETRRGVAISSVVAPTMRTLLLVPEPDVA